MFIQTQFMDLFLKTEKSEIQLKHYDPENYGTNKANLISVINLPYEASLPGIHEKEVQKRLNALPDELKQKISGYHIDQNAVKLVRTKIARIALFSEISEAN